MMDTYAFLFPFLKGAAAGALIALPIGPIGIVCMRRMLTQGAAIGIASGIGGATADSIYAGIAVAGLTAISRFIQYHTVFFRVLSALFLCALGIRMSLSHPSPLQPQRTQGIIEAYLSTFFLTLTNPVLVVLFASAFATLDFDYTYATVLEIISLIAGVFVGSSIWWIILGLIIGSLKWQLSNPIIRVINIISGLIIIGASIIALLSLFW
jgi:threonine/homoserine/homoserine lactone efflux protein